MYRQADLLGPPPWWRWLQRLQTASLCLALAAFGCGMAAPGMTQDRQDRDAVGDQATADDELRQQVAKLIEEYQAEMNEVRQAGQQATPAERAQLSAQMQKLANQTAEQMLALIQDDPQSAVAETVYLWVVRNGRQGPNFDLAVNRMIEHFPDSEELGAVASMIPPGRTAAGDAMLRRILETSTVDSVKATIMFSMARSLARQNSPEAENRTVELLETIIDKYSDVLDANRRPYGPQAEQMLFAVQNLKIGKVAPEIEGEDLDGVPFKLSDYRGKVVVIDFWGDW